MTKLEFLELLENLVINSTTYQTQPDDPSGLNTLYLIDQEDFLRNIRDEIKNTEE